MAQAKVTLTVTPEEYRTMIKHLTDARSTQERRKRDDTITPGERQMASQEAAKLTDLLRGL